MDRNNKVRSLKRVRRSQLPIDEAKVILNLEIFLATLHIHVFESSFEQSEYAWI